MHASSGSYQHGWTYICLFQIFITICNRFWFFGCSMFFCEKHVFTKVIHSIFNINIQILVFDVFPQIKTSWLLLYPNFTKSLFFIFYKYCQISIVHHGNKISTFVFTHGKVLKCGHLPTLSLCLTIISCGPLFWQCSHPQALPYTQFIKNYSHHVGCYMCSSSSTSWTQLVDGYQQLLETLRRNYLKQVQYFINNLNIF